MTFSDLSLVFNTIEHTSSRNEMTQILASLFCRATAEEMKYLGYMLLGRVAPLYEAIEFGVAEKFMIRAIAEAFKTTESEVTVLFKKEGDVGIAAEMIAHQNKRPSTGLLSLESVYQKLYEITQTNGEGSQDKKIFLLSQIFAQVDALSCRYVARIPLGKLRLGFSDMTILDAYSWMFAGDKSLKDTLEAAYSVLPDIGYIGKIMKTDGVKGLTQIDAQVGAPILASLCQRLPTADDMIKKMEEVCVEPKYDGVRVQIHFDNGNLTTYSRNLENTTHMYPELEAIGKQLHAKQVILDCEAVGIHPETGAILPFQETTTRKRKHAIQEALSQVPLRFYVFDIMFKDGKDLLSKPLSERRHILEHTIRKGELLQVSPHIVTKESQIIRTYHDEQIQKGLEGVVVKKWQSPYEPGRRGYSWVKFKEEEGKTGKLSDTIDAVVMGYTRGQGKRTMFGIGQMLLGVCDGEQFVTVTKLGSGTTEEELVSLHKQLEKITTHVMPKEYIHVNKLYIPDVWVEPHVVLEVAGDDLTVSKTHGAGFALRFPRMVRLRHDKSAKEATTKKEIQDMFHAQLSIRSKK